MISAQYKAHYNTTLSENNLHSEPLPACRLMVTPKMANADSRHESATTLGLPRHLLGTIQNYQNSLVQGGIFK